ncbi:hypothetical protein AB0A74_20825 [Saccharothrix sp. NPDC042600]|uniref:hypothetical protein n=1 Tax=Saccharothrix TaxID=2071 RepID=UPI0033C59C0A|nr:hypothetical protein GCM10017745_55810 [Saccharothrix mutabilis subsp. capreolus]
MRNTALCGLVAAVLAASVGTGTATAAPLAAPEKIDGIDLTVDLTSLAGRVTALENRLKGHHVPFKDIATRLTTRACDGPGEIAAGQHLPSDAEKRCWSGSDTDNAWKPQGITSTADASPTNSYDGRQALAVTSYRQVGGKQQARVSLLPNFAHEGYKHISLREPTGRFGTLVDCHAGGAVWYGHHLLVACTGQIKVFDWRKVYKTDRNAPNAGATLFMLQVGKIEDTKRVRFSSIALDRSVTPNLLVTSEYTDGRCGAGTCRVFLNQIPDGLGTTTLKAHDAYRMPFRMQGAVSRGDQLWTSTSAGRRNPGRLHSWLVGGPTPKEHRQWTVGSESVSYWNRGNGTGVLLTVTEHEDRRIIAAVESTHYPYR